MGLTKEQKSALNNAGKSYEKRVVEVQYDTLNNVKEADNAGAYAWDGTITVNHVKGNQNWNDWTSSDSVIWHEAKHNDNKEAGIYAYSMNREQYYKIGMHDEISANLATLVGLRDQYLRTGDVSIFEKEDKGRFAFYGTAVKNGIIKPNSDNPEEFAQEMSYMINGTQNMWMRKYSEQYVEANCCNAVYYSSKDKEGKYKQFYNENYNRALKTCYNIGGIDFAQYMQKDVEIPAQGKELLKSSKEANKTISSYDREKNSAVDNYHQLKNIKNWCNDKAEKVQRWMQKPLKEKGMILKDKFSDLFKEEETANVKNEVVNPIVHREFRKYENKDGSRVSPVIKKEITDLRREVIHKPMPIMIKRPEGYDNWLQEHSLLDVLEDMPNFAREKLQAIAVQGAVVESLDETGNVKNIMRADTATATVMNAKARGNKSFNGAGNQVVKEQMLKDTVAAHKMEKQYTNNIFLKTAKANSQTTDKTGNTDKRSLGIPQKGGREY